MSVERRVSSEAPNCVARHSESGSRLGGRPPIWVARRSEAVHRSGPVRSWSAVVLGFALIFTLTIPQPATSAQTDPALLVSEAETATMGRLRWVRLELTYPYDDITHLAPPQHLGLLVRPAGAATAYVRFDLVAVSTFIGSDPALADGLQPGDVPGLLAGGLPSYSGGIARLTATTVELLLPLSFPDGSTEASVFFVDETGPVLSNPLVFNLGTP